MRGGVRGRGAHGTQGGRPGAVTRGRREPCGTPCGTTPRGRPPTGSCPAPSPWRRAAGASTPAGVLEGEVRIRGGSEARAETRPAAPRPLEARYPTSPSAVRCRAGSRRRPSPLGPRSLRGPPAYSTCSSWARSTRRACAGDGSGETTGDFTIDRSQLDGKAPPSPLTEARGKVWGGILTGSSGGEGDAPGQPRIGLGLGPPLPHGVLHCFFSDIDDGWAVGGHMYG